LIYNVIVNELLGINRIFFRYSATAKPGVKPGKENHLSNKQLDFELWMRFLLACPLVSTHMIGMLSETLRLRGVFWMVLSCFI